MKTDRPLLAKLSKHGQYNFQHPDTDSSGVVVPKGSELSELPWIGAGGYQAWLWTEGKSSKVIWVRDDENK